MKEEITKTIAVLNKQIEALLEKAKMPLDMPKYNLKQKVWVKKEGEWGDRFFGFKIKKDTKIEDAFREEEIEQIITCYKKDSETIHSYEGENTIVRVYKVGGYYRDRHLFTEDEVAFSKEEAMVKFKTDYDQAISAIIQKEEYEKKRQIEEAQRILNNLNK